MSKKIAEGIDALILDVKTGRGAFMKTLDGSRALAASLVAIGKSAGVNTQAVITAMNWPIGSAVGNANEVIECLELLKGNGPADLLKISLELAERMLVASHVAKNRTEAAAMCRRALDSGQALERFRAVIERQGGDPRVIDDYSLMPDAPGEHVIKTETAGFVTELDAELIGRASVALGGGRDKVDDQIDPGVGIMIAATVGDAVEVGDPVLRVVYRQESRLGAALPLLNEAVRVAAQRRPPAPLIIDEVL
jgi:pyrimidine-nucleoside phosphorylase